jgi:hypothetical protein
VEVQSSEVLPGEAGVQPGLQAAVVAAAAAGPQGDKKTVFID